MSVRGRRLLPSIAYERRLLAARGRASDVQIAASRIAVPNPAESFVMMFVYHSYGNASV